jgi:2-polyprenyl-3-methyl-5-hydroxy-6-metoxy-1,4-benzoquinol methylase
VTTHDPHRTSDYDAYPAEYAAFVARREKDGVDADPFGILPRLLELLGDVAGRRVLDAGCGEGYLARVLASQGARVTGLDLSPRLIALARQHNGSGAAGAAVDFRVADLSRPLPEGLEPFDAIASYLVLNDVDDYRGFAATLSAALVPGGRLVLALNNPYGAVIRGHAADYFASGTTSPYRGLWAAGIRVRHRHRTLEEYLDAFLGAGVRLVKLADLETLSEAHGQGSVLPEGHRFPRFMLLAFRRPGGSGPDVPSAGSDDGPRTASSGL